MNGPHPSTRKAVLLALCLGFSRALALAAEPAPARFTLLTSEVLDAACFLNAVSDNPRFNEPWADLREEWLPKLQADPAVRAALDRWSGRGIQLAYLLSSLPETDLGGILKRFDDPKPLLAEIRRKLDEPAYGPVLADLEASHGMVRTLLAFLHRNGFSALRAERYGGLLRDNQLALEPVLKRFDAARFADLLEAFSGRRIPDREMRIAVLVFASPMSFQLNGFSIGWGTQKGSLDWLLAHEFMHKLNPSRENLAAQKRLAGADPLYKEAWDRVYGEFNEGKEEEFVDAASRFALLELGLASPVRNLRSMKFLYFSQKTGKGGVPLAAVLYDGLAAGKDQQKGLGYDRFIAAAFSSGGLRPGRFEEAYRKAIKPVSGMAGMVLKGESSGARVEKVFEGFPAAGAGIKAGDLLVSARGARLAGKDLDSMLDALAGESGSQVEVVVKGLLVDRKAVLTLR
ncbi:MAG: hypothetical protein WC943_00385 [Elusimicrobiota bacterium]